MKTDVWMPLYWADFLADTMHLSRCEVGSYLFLIGAYWRRGGPLLDDDAMLRNICRCPEAEWARCKGVLASFFVIEGGFWTHKRIDRELAAARQNRAVNEARARAAAEARKARAGGHDCSEHAPSIAPSMLQARSEVTPLPSPLPSPLPLPSSAPSPSPILSSDKASKPAKPAVKAKTLTASQQALAKLCESTLNGQWVNDAGKWINRLRSQPEKVRRVMAEVANAVKEGRCKSTPAQLAEFEWGQFA